MQKRRVILLLIAVVVVAGVLVVVFHREREPEYGGKRLSEWVVELGWHEVNATDAGQAKEAILHIGTNALPYLVKWLNYRVPSWKIKLYKIVDKTLKTNPDNWFLRWDKPLVRAEGAGKALETLGPQAAPAIGDLSKLLNDPKAVQSAMRATSVLRHMGDAGLPPLLAVFTNQQATGGVRLVMTFLMGDYGTNARAAVPVLMQLLKDSNPRMRAEATNALLKIDPEAIKRTTR